MTDVPKDIFGRPRIEWVGAANFGVCDACGNQPDPESWFLRVCGDRNGYAVQLCEECVAMVQQAQLRLSR